MTKMMERMNFMMGNVCDRLEKVGKHGNMAGTCTLDVRKVGAEHKSNNGRGAERPMWADYEDFGEDVDDIGDCGFKDETVGAIGKVFDSLETKGISCILMRCYGKRKERRAGIKAREIKRLMFKKKNPRVYPVF
jgi:hypothetical protein